MPALVLKTNGQLGISLSSFWPEAKQRIRFFDVLVNQPYENVQKKTLKPTAKKAQRTRWRQ
jgi:hypothetical protein